MFESDDFPNGFVIGPNFRILKVFWVNKFTKTALHFEGWDVAEVVTYCTVSLFENRGEFFTFFFLKIKSFKRKYSLDICRCSSRNCKIRTVYLYQLRKSEKGLRQMLVN